MRKILVISIISTIAASAQPVTRAVEPAHVPVALHSALADKNFYLLSLLDTKGAAREAVKADSILAPIAAAKRDALTRAAKSCGVELVCFADGLKWSEEETGRAADALRSLYAKNPAFRQVIDGALRRRGCTSATIRNLEANWRRWHGSTAPKASTISSRSMEPGVLRDIQRSILFPTT